MHACTHTHTHCKMYYTNQTWNYGIELLVQDMYNKYHELVP